MQLVCGYLSSQEEVRWLWEVPIYCVFVSYSSLGSHCTLFTSVDIILLCLVVGPIAISV